MPVLIDSALRRQRYVKEVEPEPTGCSRKVKRPKKKAKRVPVLRDTALRWQLYVIELEPEPTGFPRRVIETRKKRPRGCQFSESRH